MHTNSQKLKPDYSQWLIKTDVAAILDCSTKTVEALARDPNSPMQVVMWRRPSGGPKIAVYHPGDVEALRRKRNPGTPSSFIMPAPPQPPVSRTSPNQTPALSPAVQLDDDRMLQFVAAIVAAATPKLLEAAKSEKSPKPTVPIENKLLLTVRECVALGYTARMVRSAIAQGTLPATTIGYTRVKRSDLEKLDVGEF